ncbi:MAG: hypothetical protein EOP45_14770 [Sphingobacteriaceae bacterium]|nr:MAG: hypothetical protein EOP45_14770 [Sphingobacteriaceae bacterium]
MKKALVYLFLPIVLLNGSIYELLKTPVLISHYLTHRNNDHVSIFQFISMHYLGHDLDDHDDDEDNKLPFKKANFSSYIAFNIPLTQPGIKLNKPCYSLIQTKVYPLSSAICNIALAPSFKPPKA